MNFANGPLVNRCSFLVWFCAIWIWLDSGPLMAQEAVTQE